MLEYVPAALTAWTRGRFKRCFERETQRSIERWRKCLQHCTLSKPARSFQLVGDGAPLIRNAVEPPCCTSVLPHTERRAAYFTAKNLPNHSGASIGRIYQRWTAPPMRIHGEVHRHLTNCQHDQSERHQVSRQLWYPNQVQQEVAPEQDRLLQQRNWFCSNARRLVSNGMGRIFPVQLTLFDSVARGRNDAMPSDVPLILRTRMDYSVSCQHA